MDPDRPPRTVKFKPKSTAARKGQKAAQSKTEEADDAAQAQHLQQHLGTLRIQQPNVETKSSEQVTFINVPKQSTASRAFNVPQVAQDVSHNKSSGSEMKHTVDKGKGVKRDHDQYTPITLPWRKPCSGDPGTFPGVLDEAEFGEGANEYDECTLNPACDLGFLDSDEATEDSKPKLLFFQLPASLPIIKQSDSGKGKGKEGTSQRCCSLQELPAGGPVGKLKVYKSGASKLKLGDTQLDVSTGSDCSFPQEVVAINTEEKTCCSLGELHSKRAIVTPDVDHILDNYPESD